MALKLVPSGFLAALALLLAPPVGAAQQGSTDVLGAALEVAVEDARARVRLTYQIATAGSQVELEGIRFESVELEDGLSGGTVPLAIEHDEHGYAAVVPVADSESQLQLEYWVDPIINESEMEIVVPLLVPVGTASEPRRDFFRAIVELPDGYRLVESFPSHAERGGEDTRYSVLLPVIPGVVRVRGVTGSGGWGFILGVEVAALGLVGLLTWLGWRHLQREV